MMTRLSRMFGTALAPGGRAGRLTILIYHRVLPEPDPLRPQEPDAAAFAWQMELLATRFNVLPLSEACQRLASRSLPPRAVCVTFDDGYADNAEVALPILQRYRLPATFFVATAYLDGGCMWNDAIIEAIRRAPERLDLSRFEQGVHCLDGPESRRALIATLVGAFKYLPADERVRRVEELAAAVDAGLPTDLMMTSAQVRRLADAGMEVGGHTRSHPILATLSEAEARAEIEGGKRDLETILGLPIRLFAYPNGKRDIDYRSVHRRLVERAGFSAAVSTNWGAATAASDPFELPRFTPWDRSAERFSLRLLHNYLRKDAVAGVESERTD